MRNLFSPKVDTKQPEAYFESEQASELQTLDKKEGGMPEENKKEGGTTGGTRASTRMKKPTEKQKQLDEEEQLNDEEQLDDTINKTVDINSNAISKLTKNRFNRID